MTTSQSFSARSFQPRSFQVLPVLDIMGGVVVRGVGGRRDEYRPVQSRLTDSAEPTTVALAFREQFGLNTLYVADLDGIQRNQPQWDVLARLVESRFELLVDLGIREVHHAARLLAMESVSAIIGSETLTDPRWLKSLVQEFGTERIVFSLDLKSGWPLVSATEWQAQDALTIALDVVERGVSQLLVLDLATVGEQQGPSTLPLCREIRRRCPTLRLITGGGIRGRDDLQLAKEAMIDDVLLATALHNQSLVRADLEP